MSKRSGFGAHFQKLDALRSMASSKPATVDRLVNERKGPSLETGRLESPEASSYSNPTILEETLSVADTVQVAHCSGQTLSNVDPVQVEQSPDDTLPDPDTVEDGVCEKRTVSRMLLRLV